MTDTIELVFRLAIVLPLILFLLIITLRYINKKSNTLTNGRYLNVVERIQISKECYITIVKMGEIGVVMAVSPGNTTVVKELSKEELESIMRDKKQSQQELIDTYQKYVLACSDTLKDKLKKFRDRGRGNE
ncbi:flagellar biosynthetic protein FliO [Clostridium sp. YIM B02551]|uniref:flagellar biosynthetic protein FliO n=1 Tax=Clostridium sp. YIM B02551 TaxID=2910679 RepID=UPI001EEABDC0|nr:flagellar biosynthetic protein FliO [Clostridium sp. YIM B02551]